MQEGVNPVLSSVGQADGLLERLLTAGGATDAAWLAGIAVVVGIMLWAAGARAVSLAFAAAGGTAGLFGGLAASQHVNMPDIAGLPGSMVIGAAGATLGVVIALVAMRLVVAASAGVTAAAAAAGLAVLATPHLPPDMVGPQPSQPAVTQTTPTIQSVSFNGLSDLRESQAQTASATQPEASDSGSLITARSLADKAEQAWQRVPEDIQSETALAIVICGLVGAMLGAVWPSRIASATTAFMGAAVWPIGALKVQAIAGTPLPIEGVPTHTWLLAWLVLGIVGLCIQRFVVRRVAES